MIFKLRQNQWALVFSFLSLFILGLADNIRGPLFPEVLTYFHLSSGLGALSFAVTSSAAFLASYLSHLLLKKITLDQLLLLSVFNLAIGMAIMGLASHFVVFLIGSFLLGISIGSMALSQNLLVSENVAEKSQSSALSGLQAMYGFASFAAPLLAVYASHLTSSTWRPAFLLIAGICVIYFLLQLSVKSDPEFKVHSALLTEDHQLGNSSLWSLICFSGIFSFYVVAEILVGTRLAQYMRNYFKMGLAESSRYVTYFFLFLLIGRLFFAIKKNNFPLKIQMNVSLLGSLIFLILGLFFHPFMLTLVGLCMAPFYPMSIAYISQKAGKKARKFIIFAMGMQSLMVVAMHLGVGYLTDAFGLFYAFGVGIFALLLSLICLNFHPQKIT